VSNQDFDEFGQQIADACEVFLVGVQEISKGEDPGVAPDPDRTPDAEPAPA